MDTASIASRESSVQTEARHRDNSNTTDDFGKEAGDRSQEGPGISHPAWDSLMRDGEPLSTAEYGFLDSVKADGCDGGVDYEFGPHNATQRLDEKGFPKSLRRKAMNDVKLSSNFSTASARSLAGIYNYSMNNIDEKDAMSQSVFSMDRPRGAPVTIDLPIPLPTALDFHTFYWDCMELKSELVRLDFSLRSIGSGGPLIKATYSVRRALMGLRDLYGLNTAVLWPGDENVKIYKPGHSFAYLRKFTTIFHECGDAVDGFARALHDFYAVYHDEKLMLQLFSLHERFNEADVISSDEALYLDPKRFAERMQCILNEWLVGVVVALRSAVKIFIDKGIPVIRTTQNDMTSRYLNLTTIAFFLSGTTASILQITANAPDNVLNAAVNTCLFSSLVFSVGSAVYSLLASGWRKSFVRDPDAALPVPLRVWLNAGPMISLLISGALFAAAICLFVFTPGQHSWTSAITIAFTGLHVSGIMFLFGIFIQERWSFRRDGGPVGRLLTGHSLLLLGMEWLNSCFVTSRQNDKPQAGISIMESGRGMRTASIDTNKTSELDPDADPEGPAQKPGTILHALSDEKFLLNFNFIPPNSLRLPSKYDISMEGAGSPLSRSHSPRSRHRSPPIVAIPSQQPVLHTVVRMARSPSRSPSLEPLPEIYSTPPPSEVYPPTLPRPQSGYPTEQAPQDTDRHPGFGRYVETSSASVDPYSDAYNAPFPHEHAESPIPSESLRRPYDDEDEASRESPPLEGSYHRANVSTDIDERYYEASRPPRRIFPIDEEEEEEEEEEGEKQGEEEEEQEDHDSNWNLRHRVDAMPRSRSHTPVHLIDRPQPPRPLSLASFRPQTRRRMRGPTSASDQASHAPWRGFPVYGNVRSAAMFLPTSSYRRNSYERA